MEPGDPPATDGSSCNSGTEISEFMVHNIDDLPELLLVEILSRFPCNKFIFQCKCVSKRWCELISSPHFVRHFLSLQRDLQNPMFSTLVVETGTFFPIPPSEITSRSIAEEDLTPTLRLPLISEAEKLFVEGACNDLLLCCPTEEYQRDYYICNPYTKQWVALPPPPRVHNCIPVGFICEPYYSYSSSSSSKKDDIDGGGTCRSNNIIQLNAEYRWRVVRILPDSRVDIFFSETGDWRESVNVVCARYFSDITFNAVAYNGKLYWAGADYEDDSTAFCFELDPFGTTTTADGDIIVDKCRLTLGPVEWPVEGPEIREHTTYSIRMCLGSSQGCLQVCPVSIVDNFSVWELEEEVVGAGDDLKWQLVHDAVSLYQMDSNSKHPLLTTYFGRKLGKPVLGFHPNNKDIMYFDDYNHVIMCSLGARTLELVPEIPSLGERWDVKHIHPVVLPWWPTPLPRLN